MVSKDCATVHRHIEKIIPLVEDKPTARIPYPYLAPSYEGGYAGVVFGWDHHHMSMRLAPGVVREDSCRKVCEVIHLL